MSNERLQALAETVELLAGMQQATERHISTLVDRQVRTFECVALVGSHVQTLAQEMAQSVDRVSRKMELLIDLVHRHEDEIQALEHRGDGPSGIARAA